MDVGEKWMKVKLEAKSCCRWFSLSCSFHFPLKTKQKNNKDFSHAVKARTQTIQLFNRARNHSMQYNCKHSLRNGTKMK